MSKRGLFVLFVIGILAFNIVAQSETVSALPGAAVVPLGLKLTTACVANPFTCAIGGVVVIGAGLAYFGSRLVAPDKKFEETYSAPVGTNVRELFVQGIKAAKEAASAVLPVPGTTSPESSLGMVIGSTAPTTQWCEDPTTKIKCYSSAEACSKITDEALKKQCTDSFTPATAAAAPKAQLVGGRITATLTAGDQTTAGTTTGLQQPGFGTTTEEYGIVMVFNQYLYWMILNPVNPAEEERQYSDIPKCASSCEYKFEIKGGEKVNGKIPDNKLTCTLKVSSASELPNAKSLICDTLTLTAPATAATPAPAATTTTSAPITGNFITGFAASGPDIGGSVSGQTDLQAQMTKYQEQLKTWNDEAKKGTIHDANERISAATEVLSLRNQVIASSLPNKQQLADGLTLLFKDYGTYSNTYGEKITLKDPYVPKVPEAELQQALAAANADPCANSKWPRLCAMKEKIFPSSKTAAQKQLGDQLAAIEKLPEVEETSWEDFYNAKYVRIGLNRLNVPISKSGKTLNGIVYWKIIPRSQKDTLLAQLQKETVDPVFLNTKRFDDAKKLIDSIKGESKATSSTPQAPAAKPQANEPGKVNAPGVSTPSGSKTKPVPISAGGTPASTAIGAAKALGTTLANAVNPGATPIQGNTIAPGGQPVSPAPSPGESPAETPATGKEATSIGGSGGNPSVPAGGSANFPLDTSNMNPTDTISCIRGETGCQIVSSDGTTSDSATAADAAAIEIPAPDSTGSTSATVTVENEYGELTDEFDIPIEVVESPSPVKVGVTSFSLLSLLSVFGVLGKVFLQRRSFQKLEDEIAGQMVNADALMNA